MITAIYAATYPPNPTRPTDVGWSTSTLIILVITAAFVAALSSGLAVFIYMKKKHQSNLVTNKELHLFKPFQEDLEEVARHTGVGEIDNHPKTPIQVTDTAQVTGRPVLHGNSIIYLPVPVPGDQ